MRGQEVAKTCNNEKEREKEGTQVSIAFKADVFNAMRAFRTCYVRLCSAQFLEQKETLFFVVARKTLLKSFRIICSSPT